MKQKILFEQQKRQVKEVWKDIPDFKGYYQVSNYGNIRSVERISYYKNKKKYTKRHYQGVDLSINLNKKYEYVTLCKDGEKYIVSVHDIIFGTFGLHDTKIKKPKSKRKQVYCIDDNLVFKNISEASRYYKISTQTIKRYCQNNTDISKQKIKKKFEFVS